MKKGKQSPQLTVELERQEWCMTLGGEPVLCCVLTRPVCAGTWRGLGAINRFYIRASRAVRRYWEREVYLRACLELADRRAHAKPFRVWRVKLETQVTCVDDGTFSLWQEARERQGDGTILTVRRGDTWSLAEGAPRALSSFFQRRGWKKRVLSQIKKEARERLAGGESLLDGDCEVQLARLFDPERFYLTEDGIEVFYPMCTIAAAGEGIPTFQIRAE